MREPKTPNYAMGFVLTVVAGLAHLIGLAFIPALKGGRQRIVTAGALGFAAGIELYVAFVDILGEEAKEFFGSHFKEHGIERDGKIYSEVNEDNAFRIRVWIALSFFAGLIIATSLDFFMSCFPEACSARQDSERSSHLELSGRGLENALPDSASAAGNRGSSDTGVSNSLEHASLVAFIALTLHNIPEGLATFISGGSGSFTVPLAIAMHNIPIGAAVAIPNYQVKQSLGKAFITTLIAGLAQPFGAAVGWFFIFVAGVEELSEFLYGVMYCATAGVMVCVAIMELIPEALESASPRFVSCFVFLGFLLMECSIMMLHMAR